VHSGQHLELNHIEVAGCADTGKNRLLCPGGPVNIESELHHALNHRLNVLLGGIVLHCYDHRVRHFLLFPMSYRELLVPPLQRAHHINDPFIDMQYLGVR